MNRLALVVAAAFAGAACAEEEAEKVFRLANPSVVGLENIETSGTGVIVSTGGLILTNAHVLSSPLKYRVFVDVPTEGGQRTVVFENPKIVGFHPTLDLALLRINPAEKNIRLSPCRILRTKAGPGKRVYAIGNPAISGMTLTKSITDGMLSAVDRDIDGVKYYQISAQINPGNSGGPVLDKDGNVLGLVTLKMTDAEGVGFAIPLHDFDPAKFVPVRKGGGSARVADLLTTEARRYINLGRQLAAKNGKDDEDAASCRVIAFILLRQALAELPESDVTWSNVGLIWLELEEPKIAIAYFVRALQVKPWVSSLGTHRDLGLALTRAGDEEHAILAWREGAAKYPRMTADNWQNITIWNARKEQWEEAGYAAACAMLVREHDSKLCETALREARSKLTGEALKRMEDRIAGAEADVVRAEKASETGRSAGKKHLVPEFEKFLKDYESSNAMATDEKGARADEIGGAAPGASPPEEKPEDAASKWILSRTNMAKSYRKNSMTEKAIPILEEILAKYPDHPDSKEAKKLLEEWKRK
ncbi:MAG: trypsin-like peptidase domain-containing protein [Planctomycetes bacterium]|nr:trypsin-like peptidase domain-containing protein [Planctomycetota bacterium]